MGAWGVAIFSDDLALDIRNAWRDGVLDGRDAAELSESLIAEHGLDPDGEPAGWFALALAQHETGRLQPAVADRALALIDEGGDAEDFEEAAAQRSRALERLAQELQGPQPAPKRLRRRRPPDPGVAVGDVIQVRNTQRGRSGLFLVTGVDNDANVNLRALFWTDADPLPKDPQAFTALPYLSAVDRGLIAEAVSEADADIATPRTYCALGGRRDRAFGPHIGEVVGRNVPVERPHEISGSYVGWGYLETEVASDYWDQCLATTGRRLERYGPGWHGFDQEQAERERAHEAWLESDERAALLRDVLPPS